MGVLESQEHVLEDRQGSSPNNGVQQLREDLKKSFMSGVPRPELPKASVATVVPEREVETRESKSSRLTTEARTQRCWWSWMEQYALRQAARVR